MESCYYCQQSFTDNNGSIGCNGDGCLKKLCNTCFGDKNISKSYHKKCQGCNTLPNNWLCSGCTICGECKAVLLVECYHCHQPSPTFREWVCGGRDCWKRLCYNCVGTNGVVSSYRKFCDACHMGHYFMCNECRSCCNC